MLFGAYKGTVSVKNGDTLIPISNVIVTDGKNVVKTDKKGKFTLNGYTKSRFISITTPSGYSTERYYIPISSDIKSYDFILANDNVQEASHSFIQISDTEIHNTGIGLWATNLKEYIKNEKPAFLIHTGDICYENGLKMHIQSINSNTMGIPVYYGIGNHDLTKGEYGEELYESIYGPTWYSFDVGNTHYVMTPMAGGDHVPSYTREDVYLWLKNDLKMMKKGYSLVIFNHDLLTTDEDFTFRINEKEAINLKSYNLKAWIYGHWHYNYVRNQGGVYTICTNAIDKGGIDHSTSAFRVIDVTESGEVTTKLRYPFNKKQVTIVSPLDTQTSPLLINGKLRISTNIYNSNSEVEKVIFRLLDDENNTEIRYGEVNHQLSDWNWTTEIDVPNLYNNKKLNLHITATFSNGEKAFSTSSFLYENYKKATLKGEGVWNNLLGNAEHTGDNNSSIGKSLNLEWMTNVGANIFMTSPLIADSKIFIASCDDNVNSKSAIYAFDLLTGKELWKYSVKNSIKNTIAYGIETILAQDAEANLYALDAASGELKWTHKMVLGSFPYLTEGLVAKHNLVYAGTGVGLSAYHIGNGREIWTNQGWDKNEAATTTLTIAENILISGSQWGALYANNLHTGEFLWKLSEEGLNNRGASPTYQDGKLYLISGKSFFIIEPKSGKILKRKELNFNLETTSTPLITKNEIIFGTGDKGLVALDKESLILKWNIQTRPSKIYTVPYTTTPLTSVETSAILVNDILYFTASDGYLYIADPSSGILYQEINLGAPIFSTPAVSGNVLVVSDFGGNVYTFTSK